MSRLLLLLLCASLASAREEEEEQESRVKIAKCCEAEEILLNGHCAPLAESSESKPWKPEFEDENSYAGSKPAKEPKYLLKYGQPRCRSNENQEDVYYYATDPLVDTLVMLSNGKLRHYVMDQEDELEKAKELYGMDYLKPEDVQAKAIHYDYSFGHYCTDKAVLAKNNSRTIVATYAKICVPRPLKWANADNLIKKAIDPAFHAIAMVSYLLVAIVYFVLPQLRDLVGNIITSMMLCLIVNQSASLVRIFTEFGNHISFMIADSVMYISLLAAFFWLNALGYYVWNTFRSRNVFLRSTDGKKYCCYSTYVWGSTIAIAATAIFAHFTLETNIPIIGGVAFAAQETVGWLGLSVLFTSVAFTIIVDLCFVLTTINKLKRMRTYGRIHHKMKYSFRMFILIYSVMSVGWLSLLLSMLKYDGLVYCHIIVNVLQALLVLYICVFGQKRVTFLLGKTCNCCTSNDNAEGLDWGEEMTAINAGY
ncbi:probable G-protein coupled receptor Mth-like 5 [Nasonia vitripennis]|uniref:G-protein coupled receptors family 2 profile 2 domain-containing protein n=1 Tax=Nasonia vitripennis TaxID=7425 RepID=A0A7M7LNW0_NASVI|nr:probable G-protein coupled receptor Mth-like 5 [Nasonia vitripennis]